DVEFAVMTDSGDRLEGKIDLLGQAPDGLLVIDFRSDQFDPSDTARLEIDAERIARGLSQTTGLPVREVVFVFADTPEPQEYSVTIEAGDETHLPTADDAGVPAQTLRR